MFGGTDGSGAAGAMGDTWIWDGRSWSQLNPVPSPGARAFAGMAADGAGGIILFGGGADNADQPRNDTWRWDGHTWTLLHPAHPGPMLSGSRVMAFDPAIHAIVLYTGAQTWEWTGSDWSEVMIPGPSATDGGPRRDFALAFDPTSRRMLMFGGTNLAPPSSALGDTWAFDGRRWTRVAVGGPAGGVAVMATVSAGVDMLGEDGTWQWKGTVWSRLAGPSGPDWGYFGSMAQAGPASVLLVPGRQASSGSPQTHLWLWDGSSWRTVT